MRIMSFLFLCRSSFLFTLLIVLAVASPESQTPAPSPTHPSSISQPIHHPSRDDILTAGSTFLIQWTPNPAFSNITLELWDKTSWGYSRDFGTLCYHWINPFCGTIISHAPNTGSYLWNVPKPGSDFPRGVRVFWVKMYVDDYLKPEIGNESPVLSYSQNFAFAPEPGQVVSAVLESSSSITEGVGVGSTSVRDGVPNTGGMTMTSGFNGMTAPSGSEETMATPIATTTRNENGNTTVGQPSQGVGSRVFGAVPAVLLLFLRLF